jgi:50S ribosomal protein L16 3-hydroxylase
MSTAQFMREHWQKKPLLVRNALPGFADPLTPEELAGLACEDGVESRIVRERGGACPWEVTFGPHPEERFAALPDRGWTFLVQELNRHVPEAALLLERFAFLPNVRVDDVMVSYAVPGGSVGPHLDSYDVFIVQGLGKRRWRYNTTPTTDARFIPNRDLRLLTTFHPDVDVVVERGDLLYLPPGFAHHGTSVTPCLTYSVGFRAPAIGELWKEFARHSSARTALGALLEDPPLSPARNPGAIPPALLARVRDAIRDLDTSDHAIDRWFASFATRLAPGHELVAPRGKLTEATLFARLARGHVVARSEEGRWAFLPAPAARASKARTGAPKPRASKERAGKGALLLYVGGEELLVPAPAAEVARVLCATRRIDGRELVALAKSAAARALIVRLFALGALGFEGRA